MNIFIFTHGMPALLPQVFIDPTETVCGVFHNNLCTNGKYKYMNTPGGTFDCQQVFAKVRPQDQPDTILVHTDGGAQCAPINLPDNCVKVLLIGGATHFGKDPLQKMVQYVHAEKFDAIFVWNRHNAHFFTELGFSNVYWMPGLTFAVPTIVQSKEKKHDLCFFGQLGKYHPRRVRIIKALSDKNIKIAGGKLPRRDSLELVSQSRLSLNISLNGEFNMRVFESTQNGALLFNDELSEFSGLQLFYKNDDSIVSFANVEDLIEKLNYYSKHPQDAKRIAEKGQSITNRQFSFSARRDAFYALLNNGETQEAFRLINEPRCKIQASSPQNKNATLRRIQIYELAQEIHRTKESSRIILTGDASPFIAVDMADLVRLKQSMAIDGETFDQKINPLMQTLRVKNLSRIDLESLISEPSHLLVTSEKELDSLPSNIGKIHPRICIWDFNPENEAIAATLNTEGYRETGEHLRGLFELKKK